MFISLECNILQRHEVSSPDQLTTRLLARDLGEEQRGDCGHRLIYVPALPGLAVQSARPEAGNGLVARKRHSILSPRMGAERWPACHHRECKAAAITHGLIQLLYTQRSLQLQMLNHGGQGLTLGPMTSR